MTRLAPTFALVLAAALAGCGPGAECELPAPAFSLPADEAPHDNWMEWWYYTGHLLAGGERFGFELSFFQTFVGDQVGYAAHFAVSDPQRGEHEYAQDLTAPPQRFESFDLAVGDWTMAGDGRADRLVAAMDGWAIDLELVPERPATAHNGRGVIEMGGGMTSFYYSKTRLAVAGELTRDGTPLAVSGQAWHDHQWGDFEVFSSDGWDWFSLQLDDGTDLMLFLLHFRDRGTEITGGTLVDADGCPHSFETFELEVTGSWTSPHTGGVYPQGWRLRLPAEELDLTLTTPIADQEMDCRQSTLNTYWEGEIEAVGTHRGKPVAGLGYVELAGYGPWGL